MSKYDAVIIGSGLGSLCCAYILAKEGMRVCVLEKNRQIGGSLQIFSRNKTIFDTGVHYIGALEEGQNLNSYFKYFGLMQELKLQKLDQNAYDIITFKDDTNFYPHAQGYNNFIEQLARFFPREKDNLKLYIEKVKETCAAFPMYNLSDRSKEHLNPWYLEMDAKTAIESFFTDKKLQQIIAGNSLLYAGVAGKTPFYIHALVVNSYIESAYRCVDGSAQIAKILSNHIKHMGGEIYNYSEAKKFHFKNSEVESVELTNGDRIEGKIFISGIDLRQTVDMVEGPELRAAYKNRIRNLENTISSFLLHAVTKSETVPYFNYNMYHCNQPDIWTGVNYTEQTWPESFGIFGTSSSKQPSYTENFTVMTYMRFEECRKWVNTKNIIPNHTYDRGEEYEAFKEQKAKKLLEHLEQRLPGISANIQSYTCSTPVTYRDYIGSKDGTMYGVLKDYKDPQKTFITAKTKINNLYLTGQSLNLHGVMGVTVSAAVTCSDILGHPYLINKIKQSL